MKGLSRFLSLLKRLPLRLIMTDELVLLVLSSLGLIWLMYAALSAVLTGLSLP